MDMEPRVRPGEHADGVVTLHAEVADLVFTDSTSAAVIMRITDNRVWNETPIVLSEGATRTLVPQAFDFRGVPMDLVSRRDLEIRGEIVEPNVVWEPQSGRGCLIALAPGTTRVRFHVWQVGKTLVFPPAAKELVRGESPSCAPPRRGAHTPPAPGIPSSSPALIGARAPRCETGRYPAR